MTPSESHRLAASSNCLSVKPAGIGGALRKRPSRVRQGDGSDDIKKGMAFASIAAHEITTPAPDSIPSIPRYVRWVPRMPSTCHVSNSFSRALKPSVWRGARRQARHSQPLRWPGKGRLRAHLRQKSYARKCGDVIYLPDLSGASN